MTVSVSKDFSTSFLSANGAFKVIGIFTLSFSDTYSAGGDSVDFSAYLRKLDIVVPIGASGYIFEITSISGATAKVVIRYPTSSASHSVTTGDAVHTDCGATGAAYTSATSLGTFVTSVADHGSAVGEELADGASYPANLSIKVLVIGS